MNELTVILPCAGKASRLQLPYPKELMKINATHALIDYSFDHFKKDATSIRFVIIVNSEKMALVHYLRKYSDTFSLAFVYQNSRLPEVTGAIKSARHLFGDENLVLLPDTIMEMGERRGPLLNLIREGLRKTGWSFLYRREKNEALLRQMGCLMVKQNLITDYEDKPRDGFQRFNSFWTGFAFTREAFKPSIGIIEKSTMKKRFAASEFRDSPIYRSVGVEVSNFVDMGTWDGIHSKLIKDHLAQQNIHLKQPSH